MTQPYKDMLRQAEADLAAARAEIERLTKERQAFEGMAKDNYDRLQKAEAERDEARAQVAFNQTTVLAGATETPRAWLDVMGERVMQITVDDWPISYTSEIMQIGCQRHPLDAWRNFSDAEIRAMDGRKALTFWHKWRETIFKIIEMAPAQPTKTADPVEPENDRTRQPVA